MLFFTVLINAYNYGHYIEEAINSVLNQTLSSHQFEVIVIDDGSTDDTGQEVTKFGDSVRYFYQENSGQAAAFNTGIAYAKGEFVAFLDADDIWCKEKLECIKNFLNIHTNVDLVYHSLIQINEGGKVLATYPRYPVNKVIQYPLPAFLNGTLEEGAPTSGITCRRSMLQKLFPVPSGYRICADSYLQVTVPLIVRAIGYIAQPLALYRIHQNNNFTRFDTQAGRYAYRDEKLMIEKLKLDIVNVELVGSKFNVDIKGYCVEMKYQLAVQEALSIRREQGLIKAISFLIGSMRDQKSAKNTKLFYRFTSVTFRLIFGDDIFNALASRYIGSHLHAFVHSIVDARQVQSAHE